MNRQIPDYLRLHVEEPAAVPATTCRSVDALDRLCESFRHATGWMLRHEPGAAPLQSPEVLWARSLSPAGDDMSHLAIHRSPGKSPRNLQNELVPMCDLVDSIADLVGQVYETRRALIQREAELATGIPLVSHVHESHLAERLQAVLRGGAEAIDVPAAALYVLDDATTELKLRCSWGLPADRFLEPARPLRGSIADLEALTGHAVAIDDVSLLPHWKVPEEFRSALCVPISSATTPLGTLWMFGENAREFSTRETNLVEIIAGRIAAELEREVLLAEAAQRRGSQPSPVALSELQDAQLPIGPIATDHWEVAALCHQGRGGSEFYDWHMHENGALTIALAAAPGADLDAAWTLQLIRGAVKGAMLGGAAPERLMRSVAALAWTSTAGQCRPSLAVAKLPVGSSEVEFASAGPLGAMIVRPTRPSAIGQANPPLASDPDFGYRGASHVVEVGELVVLVGDAVRKSLNAQGEQLGEAAIADCLRDQLARSAEDLLHAVFALWREHSEDPRQPAAILVAKRTR